ncbi:MAG: DsrE family protein [bacterium]|nr:DsrE family protein [bacterium]
MKKVAIIIRALPFNTIRNSEALRCAVGLTIEEENKIQVLFIGDGVWTAASLDSKAVSSRDLGKHVETLEMMEAELIAEEEALAARGIKVSREEIATKPREGINQAIREADVVMAF